MLCLCETKRPPNPPSKQPAPRREVKKTMYKKASVLIQICKKKLKIRRPTKKLDSKKNMLREYTRAEVGNSSGL